MTARHSGSGRHFEGASQRHLAAPCIDRFGACVSVVVVAAALTAVFVLRQNIDDHVYNLASNATAAETTGAAVAK